VAKIKAKTHKGAKRRFAMTSTGKLQRTHGMKSHFRRRKAPRVKRAFDRMTDVHKSDEQRIRRMLPNGV
jgi:large subunit ribosomal protein L35